MNFENIGLSIAKVINENNKTEKIISVESDKDKVKDYFEEYKCLKGEYIQQIPVKQNSRSVGYISGKSGSGKSTYSRKYIEQYHKMYKKRPIYVFSYFKEDPSLDSLKYIKRIPMDDKFLSTEFMLDPDFKDCLCLFDDIDLIKHKALKNKVFGILYTLLEGGRHVNCELLVLSHIGCKGGETRTQLSESTSITIFPRMINARACKYILETYMGMDKNQIKRVKQLNSRWVTVVQSYPNVVLWNGGCYVLKCDD
jgi:hypothetical protein